MVPSGRLSAATQRTAVPKSFPLFHVLDASRFKFDLYTTAHSGISFLPFPVRCEMFSRGQPIVFNKMFEAFEIKKKHYFQKEVLIMTTFNLRNKHFVVKTFH